MTKPINCNYMYVCAAIHHFTTKHMNKKHQLPKGSYGKILRDYNKHFSDTPALRTTYSVVSRRFLLITRIFSNKWHPNESKTEFLSQFSTQLWLSLQSTEKEVHTCTLHECFTCTTVYKAASQAFPICLKYHKQKKKCNQLASRSPQMIYPLQKILVLHCCPKVTQCVRQSFRNLFNMY